MARGHSDKLYVYTCRHKRTNAIIFTAVSMSKGQGYIQDRLGASSKTIMSRIHQLLNKKITRRAPLERHEIYQFIQDKRLNIPSYQLPFEWEVELLETVYRDEYLVRVRDLINNLRHNGYTVLSTADRTPSPKFT